MAVCAPVSLSFLVVGDGDSLVTAAMDETVDPEIEATVETVADGGAARDRVEGGQFDCVVVTGSASADVPTLVSTLRDVAPDQPIVVVVGDGTAETDVLAAGATDVAGAATAADHPRILADRLVRAVERAPDRRLPGSRDWYDALVEHSMDTLTVLDADGTISFQNASVERLLGYDSAALVGDNSLDYVHPDDRDRVEATFADLYERGDGATETFEFRFRAADGDWEWLESMATTRTDRGIGGFVVNTRLITERKEREREVDRYETLLSVLPDTIAIVDLEGYHVDVYGLEAWSGYERDELVGEHISKTTPDADIERGQEVVADLLGSDDRDRATYETRFETKDGEVIPLENHVTALPPDDEGRIPGTMNVLRNISARKERERRLQQAETVFQNVRDGVFLVDVTADGRFEYLRVNEAYEAMTGFAESDVRGRTASEFIPDEDIVTQAEDLMAEVVDTGSAIHEEHFVDYPDLPMYLDVWAAPVIVDGEVDSVIGVIRDITERKEREQELQRKNRAMDEAPIGITIVEVTDDGPIISYVNEGFQELTGYQLEDFDGEGLRILHGPETDAETVDTLQRAYRNREATSVAVQVYTKDGSPRWFQVNISPVRDDDGEVTHYVGFQQDVTDRKEYETEIERRFDEFADVFAEDLREPIEAAQDSVLAAREDGDEEALASADEWLQRADDLLADLATVHSFSVPSRDHSESALRGQVETE